MARRFDPDDIPELPPELEALLPTSEELAKFLHQRLGQQHAVLDENGEAQPASLIEWAMWLEKNHTQRVTDRTDVERELAGLPSELYTVSTVFLGLNHQYVAQGKPLWFETMVFGPPYQEYSEMFKKMCSTRDSLWMDRGTTRAEALAMHQAGIDWVKAHIASLDARMQSPQSRHEPTTGS